MGWRWREKNVLLMLALLRSGARLSSTESAPALKDALVTRDADFTFCSTTTPTTNGRIKLIKLTIVGHVVSIAAGEYQRILLRLLLLGIGDGIFLVFPGLWQHQAQVLLAGVLNRPASVTAQ